MLTVHDLETAPHDLKGAPLDPETADLDAVAAAAMRQIMAKTAGAGLNFEPERVEKDLTRLVLSLIEFVRRLLEAQAVRRMEAGRLTEAQEERLGETLMRARERLIEVAAQFDLTADDLRLDLGPLGRAL